MLSHQVQCNWLTENVDMDEGDDESVEAPPFSPISVTDMDDINFGGAESASEVSEGDKSDNLDDEDDDIDGGLHEHSGTSTIATTSSTVATTSSNAPATSVYNSHVCNGYKIPIDNFDRNIRASYQRIDRTTESFHCVHLYAALDRIDFSGLSDTVPTEAQVDLNCLLPTEAEISTAEEHFAILIER